MSSIWFNQGYSSTRDAIVMIRAGAEGRVRLVASHVDPGAAVLEAADTGFAEPVFSRDRDDAYVDWCLGVCAERAIDLFVPQSRRGAVAARIAEFAAIGTRVSVAAPAETLALIDDKARFFQAATAIGIPMPWTREVGDVAGFDAAMTALADAGLAACIKPPHGVFGAGFWRLDRQTTLFDTLMDAEAHVIAPDIVRNAIAAATAPLRLLVLECLPGTEWSIDCVCDGGALLVGVARRKDERTQLLEVEGPIFDIARTVIAAFKLSGLINVQLKADAAGSPRLLEINTRMSGGCSYTTHSGVNLPWWHVATALGLATADDIPTPVGGAVVAPVAASVRIDQPADEFDTVTAYA